MVAIVVHGGAAKVAPSTLESKLFQLRLAAKLGFIELLLKKSHPEITALDAVQNAVKHMENSPFFNAGHGSSLTSLGQVEMDAIITDGRTINFGAVASVTDFPNPILIARGILDHSEHCLFARDGAHEFAKKQGLKPIADRNELIHDLAKQRLDEYKTFENAIYVDRKSKEQSFNDHDTVGSVAIDWHGNVAAATSTGGITGKLPGRIGDTPVIGSGAYADNEIGAVSTTGHGEAIMRVCLAREVLYKYQNLINSDDSRVNPMQQAVDNSLKMMQSRIDGYGGIIAIGNGHGDIGIGFNTEYMPWAYITVDDNGIDQIIAQLDNNSGSIDRIKVLIHYGYHHNEHLTVLE